MSSILGDFVQLLFVLVLFTSACVRNSPDYILLSPESTGVDIVNEITESDSIDVSSHPFLYNGAAASDLDKDGDLDLVINNLNSNAFIYKNQLNSSSNSIENNIRANFSQVKIIGTEKNPDGIGSKLKRVTGDTRQYRYISLYRGYISSTDIIAHFGLGENDQIDSLIVT